MKLFNKLKNKRAQEPAASLTTEAEETTTTAVEAPLPAPSLGARIIGRTSESDPIPPVPARTARTLSGSFGFGEFDDRATDTDAHDVEEISDELDDETMTRQQKKDAQAALGTMENHGHLMVIKPREHYVFHSDYFEVDDEIGTILSFFHNEDAKDEFGAFWGVNRIPRNLPEGVSAVLFEQVERMKQSWIDDNLKNTDRLAKTEESDLADSSTKSNRRKTVKRGLDLDEVIAELDDGASYLTVHNRLLLRGPNLEILDSTVEKIRRSFIEHLSRMDIAAHHGEQRQELSQIFGKNSKKRGKGFHFTSTEFAGSYSLVTNGLNDVAGEYVGVMRGDVNNSAVLFDVDRWSGHVVCADSSINTSPLLKRPRVVDMWGSKISQAALLNNRRVVHLVLNGAKLDEMGPKLESMTAHVDMTSGDLNMFELFGKQEDELSLYSTHMDKIVFMTEQVLGDKTSELALLRGKLKEIITAFYVDMKMWALNAGENRDKLRLVGVPHEQIPLLSVFVSYLDQEYERQKYEGTKDPEMFRAISVLRLTYKDLLDTHGDLFNQHTADGIDSVNSARRVIYDFSGVLRRGAGVAMAQLVNVIGFAVETLGQGDVVIIHGADGIVDVDVQDYLANQFAYMAERGGRVAYLYSSMDAMLGTVGFNQFQRAAYTILGPMNVDSVDTYQSLINSQIPMDLARLVTTQNSGASYLRRGSTNVVFETNLALGVNPYMEQRRKIEAQRGQRRSKRDKHYGGGTTMVGTADLDVVAIQAKAEHREERFDEKSARKMKELDDVEAKELALKTGPKNLDDALAQVEKKRLAKR